VRGDDASEDPLQELVLAALVGGPQAFRRPAAEQPFGLRPPAGSAAPDPLGL